MFGVLSLPLLILFPSLTHSLTHSHAHFPHQCICYDITNYSTFESIQRWVKKLQQEADKNCFIVLVGNKYDLVEQDPSLRKVDKAEVKRYAQTIDAEVFEASAKSGMNVADIFSHVRCNCTLFDTFLHFQCFNR